MEVESSLNENDKNKWAIDRLKGNDQTEETQFFIVTEVLYWNERRTFYQKLPIVIYLSHFSIFVTC